MAAISNTASIRDLAALMHAHGVTRCVACPGSRNSPIVDTLAALPDFELRGATDERSAGFVACGWAAQSQAPVAVCVTSGSALLNLHPAVSEAFYRRLPLLVISADRPASWIGQQDGQTLPQPGVFGTLCRKSVQLPEAEDEHWHRNRLLNEALLELRHRAGGPVHINIPLSEPLFGTTAKPLPTPRIIRRTELAKMNADEETELLDTIAACPRRLILLGQLPQDAHIPPVLAAEKAFAIIGEHLCNSAIAITQPDAVLGPRPSADMSPDLLITYGGCIISKRLKTLLRNTPPKEHWHISPDGDIVDTFCCLTRVIEGEPAELWELLAAFAEEGDENYAGRWLQPVAVPDFPYSGMQLVGDLLRAMPEGSVLHLANSSAVRFAQLYPLPENTQVECNRGVNGIEGSLSSALGYAMGDTRPQFIICGDLSFFYDMNALWLQGIPPHVRILLINNGGGGIFDLIPTPENPLVNGAHQSTATAWAQSCGFECLTVHNPHDWPAALAALTTPGNRPVLVEAFTDSVADATLFTQFNAQY
ncbi:MAG: 2-succinyl-5-enolpyruvyl-6-hydroxy-3-cyclohexene-1-carboxylic-acid synthase [Akkermansia sp.]|nr:2-succinyl-5-enolpyruvyl-6-hydroxy-3-cyclohexene-1-carboxylic-acid synthase [Akkermansia sp.]